MISSIFVITHSPDSVRPAFAENQLSKQIIYVDGLSIWNMSAPLNNIIQSPKL